MKIVVYSVSTGGYDELKTPKVYDPNIRYILFTDNKYFKSDVWEVNHIDFIEDVYDNVKSPFYYIMDKVNILSTNRMLKSG